MFLCSDLINIEIKSIRSNADTPKIILGWYLSSKKSCGERYSWREMICGWMWVWIGVKSRVTEGIQIRAASLSVLSSFSF